MAFSPKRREAVSTGSSTPDLLYVRRNFTNNKLSCFRFSPAEDKAEEVRFHVRASEKQQPNSLRRSHGPTLSSSSDNTQGCGYGRHFRFDPRWGDAIHANAYQYEKDEQVFFKRTTLLPPVANPRCSINRKDSPYTISCTLVSEDRCRLNAASSDPVSIAAVPLSPRGISKNTRKTSRVCNLSSLTLSNPDESYADPVLGASTPFIRRLLDMSTLQEKTIRHERIVEFKKNRRHDY